MFEISDDPVVLRSRLFSFLTYILSRGHCLKLNLLLDGDHPEAPITHHGFLLHPSILGYLTFRKTSLIHFANAYFTFIDTQKRKVILLFFTDYSHSLKNIYMSVCMNFTYMCMCVHEGQRMALHPLDLELQLIMHHHVCAGNQSESSWAATSPLATGPSLQSTDYSSS